MKIETILRTSLIVFFLLVAAKFLNFFKKILIGQLFGVSWIADAFFAASFLPYYLAIFFEGVLFLGFLPLYSKIVTEQGAEEAGSFLREVFLAVSLITVGLALVGIWTAPWIVGELVPGFSAAKQSLTVSLFQILTWVVVFISLTSFFKALNSYYEEYSLAASSGLLDTVVMIGMTLLTWKFWGIYGAAWGAVTGAVIALLFQMAFLARKQPHFFQKISFRNAWLAKLFYFFIPMAVIWFFQQIPLVILNRFGSGMWEGTISALNISHTLTTVPMGLVSHTVLFTIFPSLAKQSTEAQAEDQRATFFLTLRGGFLILIPIGFLLTALARPLAVLFFSGGGIEEEGTRRIANSLACFGWATFALYADLFMTQSLIAVRRTPPAIFLAVSRAVLTYVLGYGLSILWDYQGIALSFSLALAVNLFIFFPFFFRWSPFDRGWGSLFIYAAKLISASLPLLLAGWWINRWPLKAWLTASHFHLLFTIAFFSAVAALLYLGLLMIFRVEEMRSVIRELKRGWERKSWWLAEPVE